MFYTGNRVNYTQDVWQSITNPCTILHCLGHTDCDDQQSELWLVKDSNDIEWHLNTYELELVAPSSQANPSSKETTSTSEIITTNKNGGKNSKIDGRYDLIPPLALKELAKVYEEGAIKYSEWNWTNINETDHVNHALNHIFQYLDYINPDDRRHKIVTKLEQVEELSHAFCRLSMALELLLRR